MVQLWSQDPKPLTNCQLPVRGQGRLLCLLHVWWTLCGRRVTKTGRRERGWDEGGGWSGGGVASLLSTHDLYVGSLRWIKPSRSSRSLWWMHLHHATWAEILLPLPPTPSSPAPPYLPTPPPWCHHLCLPTTSSKSRTAARVMTMTLCVHGVMHRSSVEQRCVCVCIYVCI